MSTTYPTLHMFCGKIASGKSTLASRLAAAPGTVLIAEDDWLDALFADELKSLQDYARCSKKLRHVMGPHVAAILSAGVSVVLDFPANTVEQRAWMRDILTRTSAAHQLHVFDVADEICLSRLRARNVVGDHPFAVSEALFHQASSHLTAPTPDEGFTLVFHDETGNTAA